NLLPSADEAIDVQYWLGARVDIHFRPKSTVLKIRLGSPKSSHDPANNLFPSAEDVMQFKNPLGASVPVQVSPESLDVKTEPSTLIAVRLLPSAEDVRCVHPRKGALDCTHVSAALVEVNIGVPNRDPVLKSKAVATATSFCPSADEATDDQF